MDTGISLGCQRCNVREHNILTELIERERKISKLKFILFCYFLSDKFFFKD